MFLERILALCKAQKISKNKLLTDLNLNKSAFVNWGNRGNIPSGDVIAKIADYFHVSTDYLLGRTDDPRPVGQEIRASPLRAALLGSFDQLNQEGQEKLVDTADDMVSSGKYIKSDPDQLGKAKNA